MKPHTTSKFEPRPSPHHGMGVFATAAIPKDTVLLAVRPGQLGRGFNYSRTPNITRVKTYADGAPYFWFKTTRAVKRGQELTLEWGYKDFKG